MVEAAAQSGSLITASLALEYGKDVFAVPGSIFDENYNGTHHLIMKGGAKLITSADDVLIELGMHIPTMQSMNSYRAQTPDESVIIKQLSAQPISVNDLVEKTSLATATINATLTLMEVKGGVRNVGSGQWVKM